MPQRRSYAWPVLTTIVAILVVIIALPQRWRAGIPVLGNPRLHLGLDLAGGTQLDFRISEEEIRSQLQELNKQIADAQAHGASAEELQTLELQRRNVQEQQQNLVEA